MKLYVICDDRGKFYRGSYWKEWALVLEDAKIYVNQSTTKRQITKIANRKLNEPVPSLVVLEAQISGVIPQTERVRKANMSKKEKQKQKEINMLNREIKEKEEQIKRLKGV